MEELMQYIGYNDISSIIIFSPDEQLVYFMVSDGTARVYEVATGVELEVVPATQLLLTLRQEVHGPLDGSAQFLVARHGQALGQGQRTDGV